MTTQIKITQLTDIGSANLAVTTLLPVVNMAGVPTTQKTTLGNLANVILSQSGSNFAQVALANLSYAVSNAAQPNITSTGTLTSLSVSGNANIGNIGTAGLITATGNVGAGNLNTTGLVNAGTLSVTGTTNLGAVGNVTITGGTNGQVLTTNGSNVLSWTTVSSSSSNTAVTVTANAQPNITSVGNLSYLVVNGNVDATNIDTANTVYANYFVGDGSSITDIDATNVIGNVANANYSTYAGTVITGAQPNITSVGNLAGLTITGVTTLGTVTNLGDVGNVKIDGGIDGDVLGTDGANLFWVAQTDIGNFSFSNNIISLNVPANLVVNSDGQNFIVNANSRLFTYKPDGNLVLPGGSQIYDNSGNLNITSSGLLLSLGPNANTHSDWWFSGTGNLTLPGNTFAINYANGAQVSIGGNTGNVTFDDVTVQGVNGLNLSAGADFTANLAYLQVRAGDVASHIHLDTGNNDAYDLIVGDDQNYVQVSSTGNILLSSYDSNTAQYTWTLDYNGNLILAGGNSVIQSIANSSLDPLNPNVSTMVLTPDPGYSSQALVLDPTAPGHIHLRAYASSNIDDPAANIFLGGEDTAFEITSGSNNQARIHSGGNTWTFGNDGVLTTPSDINIEGGITGNGSVILQSAQNGNSYVNLDDAGDSFLGSFGNVSILTDLDNREWVFDTTGTLTAPGDITVGGDITGKASANTLVLKAQPTTNTYIQLNSIVDSTIQTHANLEIVTDSSNTSQSWTFGTDGRLSFPGTPRIDTSANNFEVQAAENINFEASSVVNIYTDGSGNAYQWQFGDDSDLLTPGNIDFGNGSRAYITYGANNYISLNNDGGMDLSCNTEVKITTNFGDTPNRAYSYFYANGNFATGSIVSSGNISGGNISTTGNISGNTNGYTIGYLNIPQVAASNTTLALGDAGKHYYSTTAGNFTLTIPNNATTSFATGTAISIVVQAAGNILVNADTGVTLYMAGNSTAANRVVGGYGMATLMKVATDTWFINGTGVS